MIMLACDYSPPVRRVKPGSPGYDEIYGGIQVPLMVMSGTKDVSPVGDQRPDERRVPFDRARSHEGELITFRPSRHEPVWTPLRRRPDARYRWPVGSP